MLEFLFITILVIWLLGWIGRLLLRWWLSKKQRQFTQQFGQGPQAGQSARGGNPRSSAKKEGEISVRQTEIQEKKVSKSVGDYVDFEEVGIVEEKCEE